MSGQGCVVLFEGCIGVRDVQCCTRTLERWNFMHFLYKVLGQRSAQLEPFWVNPI